MKKFICFLLAFTMLFALCSCDGYYENLYEPPHNAIMYSKHNSWINPSFLADNKVSGAYYENENYNESDNDLGEKYYYDETSPENRIFIINGQDTYNTIFKVNTLSVDFDKEIVYLYMFADIYPSRNYLIYNISINEDQVCIYYKLEENKNNKADSTAPYQRCLIVKMDKVNVEEVEFIKEM